MKRETSRAFYTDTIENISTETRSKRIPEQEIYAKLLRFGLSEFEIELLMLRFIDRKKMREIVKEQGWTSVNSANHFLRTTLKKLREGKFTIR